MLVTKRPITRELMERLDFESRNRKRKPRPIRIISDHPLFNCWRGMRRRCTEKSYVDYPSYGGRGITMCERWKDFWDFVADMGPKPTPEHTIERIDNNGNYEPTNCRWATRKEQANNRG